MAGKAGGLDHVILFGAEATSQATQTERISGYFSPTSLTAANRRATIAFTTPLPIPQIFFVAGPAGNNNRSVASAIKQVSAYVQDQLKLGGGFEVIAGLRFDRLSSVITNRFTGAQVVRVDQLWSPRAGLVFKPAPQASLYLSTSKSYLPQSGDQFTSFDASFAALEPETFHNIEAGVKWDISPALTATAAIYRLERGNSRATGPTPGSVVLTGKQRSEGLEIGLSGRITPAWQAAFGYSLTQAKVTETTTAAPAGRTIGQVPRHQLSLWNKVDLTRTLGLGVGLYHQSSSFATISHATRLPAYTRVDAALYWALSRRIELQLNLENLGNVQYFPTAHNDNNITTGAPLNARIAMNVTF